MNTGERIVKKANLILKYQNGTLTPQEREELRVWLDEDQANRAILEDLNDEKKLANGLQFLDSIDKRVAWERLTDKINEPVSPGRVVIFRNYWKYSVAAVLLLCLGFVFFLYTYTGNRSKVQPITQTNPPNDVLPGGNKATLALADGSVWDLESIKIGTFREENGIRVSKKNGQIVYEVLNPVNNQAVTYNTITTPIGGQYKLVLQDGSQVWLNAASSLRFPTTFDGQFRHVDLTGEAYFEISKNQRMPFVVQTGTTSIEVVGTHFNVMAYENEGPVKTSLLEGVVNVSNGTIRKRLMPGQQALTGKSVEVKSVDMDEVVAWKNGYFQFENEDLKTILRQLKRWYHIDIDKEAYLPDKHFTAVISRNTTLAQVLSMLEMSGELTFSIDNNRVKITENH